MQTKSSQMKWEKRFPWKNNEKSTTNCPAKKCRECPLKSSKFTQIQLHILKCFSSTFLRRTHFFSAHDLKGKEALPLAECGAEKSENLELDLRKRANGNFAINLCSENWRLWKLLSRHFYGRFYECFIKRREREISERRKVFREKDLWKSFAR